MTGAPIEGDTGSRAVTATPGNGLVALFIALLLGVLYSMLVTGVDTGLFSDTGRWHHEVERFAQGEVPYRDFYWYFPPASLWLVGGIARITGTGLVAVQVTTTAVFLGIIAVTWRLVRLTAPEHTLMALLAALILANAYAGSLGVPLPLGYYIPAAPVGMLALLGATVALAPWRGAATSAALATGGSLAGVAVISKQDFWLPSLLLVSLSALATFRSPGPWLRRTGVLAATALVPVVAGALYVVWVGEDLSLARLVGGLGVAGALRGRAYPSWERVTLEIITGSATLTVIGAGFRLVGGVRQAARATLASAATCIAASMLFLFMTIRTAAAAKDFPPGTVLTGVQQSLRYHVEIGNALWRPAIGYLRVQGIYDGLPLLLSTGLLVFVLLRWRRWSLVAGRNQAAALLALWVAARFRRGFEVTEWFEPLLAVPALLCCVRLIAAETSAGPRVGRIARTLLVAAMAMGCVSYWQLQRGPLTRRPYAVTRTVQGTVRWQPNAAADYALLRDALQRLDPTGERPLFAAGASGPINYYLGRRNPTPFTHDFYHSNGDPDPQLSTLLARTPDLILVDYLAIGATEPNPRMDLRQWALRSVPGFRATYNKPRFAQLAAQCTPVPWPEGTRTALRLYDCLRPPSPSAPPPTP